jgi:hypothetical protein
MGLKDLLPGGGKPGALPLDEGETELAREVAAVHPGTLSSLAGDLVLTTSRLVFVPLESRRSPPPVSWNLPATPPAPKGRTKARTGQPDLLTGIRRGRASTLMAPPTLVLTAGDGTTWEIGILAGRRKANRAAENSAARDRMVQTIQRRLA